jgi:hypothetical protein
MFGSIQLEGIMVEMLGRISAEIALCPGYGDYRLETGDIVGGSGFDTNT